MLPGRISPHYHVHQKPTKYVRKTVVRKLLSVDIGCRDRLLECVCPPDAHAGLPLPPLPPPPCGWERMCQMVRYRMLVTSLAGQVQGVARLCKDGL